MTAGVDAPNPYCCPGGGVSPGWYDQAALMRLPPLSVEGKRVCERPNPTLMVKSTCSDG